jgi:hypothetical protein
LGKCEYRQSGPTFFVEARPPTNIPALTPVGDAPVAPRCGFELKTWKMPGFFTLIATDSTSP